MGFMQNNKNNSRHRPRHRNKNNARKSGQKRFSKKPLSGGKIIQKYDNLLEQHLQARRKYFEMFHRASDGNLRKLKKIFDESLENLRRFEEKLEDWQRETLEKKINAYKLDTIFSEAHNTGLQGEAPPNGPFKNPHITQEQLEREDFSRDTQESVGTMDDYLKYKDSRI